MNPHKICDQWSKYEEIDLTVGFTTQSGIAMKAPMKAPKQEQASLVVSVDKVEEKVQNTPISSVTTATVASATSMPNKTALRSSSPAKDPASKKKRSRVESRVEGESPQETALKESGARRSLRSGKNRR